MKRTGTTVTNFAIVLLAASLLVRGSVWAQPSTHEYDEEPSTAPSGLAADSTACPVPGLSPITDPEGQKLEASNGIWTEAPEFDQSLLARMRDFEARVEDAGGSFHLSSAFRHSSYQLHLQETWDKWNQLKQNTDPRCVTRKANIRAHMIHHEMLVSKDGVWVVGPRPAGAKGPHTLGYAFDATVKGISNDVRVDHMAALAGLYRPGARKNPNHGNFLDLPHYESREEKFPRGWCPQGVIETVVFEPGSKSVDKGKSLKVLPVARDESGRTVAVPSDNYVWKTSDQSIATVGPRGTITGVKAGKATITAMEYTSGHEGTLEVRVGRILDHLIPPQPVVLVGGTTSLTAIDTMGEAMANDSLEWSSSSANVTVGAQTGVITGVKSGTANVTATDPSTGKSAAVLVTVSALDHLGPSNPTVAIGMRVYLTAYDNAGKAIPSSNLDWSSTSSNVTVGPKSGGVMGNTAGRAVVIAKEPVTGKTASISVTVLPSLSGTFKGTEKITDKGENIYGYVECDMTMTLQEGQDGQVSGYVSEVITLKDAVVPPITQWSVTGQVNAEGTVIHLNPDPVARIPFNLSVSLNGSDITSLNGKWSGNPMPTETISGVISLTRAK